MQVNSHNSNTRSVVIPITYYVQWNCMAHWLQSAEKTNGENTSKRVRIRIPQLLVSSGSMKVNMAACCCRGKGDIWFLKMLHFLRHLPLLWWLNVRKQMSIFTYASFCICCPLVKLIAFESTCCLCHGVVMDMWKVESRAGVSSFDRCLT